MRWQAGRGLLEPLDASPPGSVWWRAMNERLLRDGCEAVALLGGWPASRRRRPCASGWPSPRADRGQLVPGAQREHRGRYLEHRELAEAESAPERFFMNVALLRVLYAHALARRRAWRSDGSLRSAACSATPGSGWPACSSPWAACCPTAIRSRTTSSATSPTSSARPAARLRGDRAAAATPVRVVGRGARRTPPARAVRDGNPIYAWPFEQRDVWRPPEMPFAGRVLERVTRVR